jgi:hypothetical protein
MTRPPVLSMKRIIVVIGLLIAVSAGAAILITNRYQVSEPFRPSMFTRFNRWTGKVEQCSSIYDDTTYCGSALSQRIQTALNAEHEAEHQTFLRYGYTQEQIDRWPPNVLDKARNIVGNGGDKAMLDDMIHEESVRH